LCKIPFLRERFNERGDKRGEGKRKPQPFDSQKTLAQGHCVKAQEMQRFTEEVFKFFGVKPNVDPPLLSLLNLSQGGG
jgi:hypothetical protein